MKKVVYLASPYRSDNNFEKVRFREYARKSAEIIVRKYDAAPVVPHLMFPQFLSDEPADDELARMAGLSLLSKCDELWVMGKYGISAGMQAEINFAQKLNIPIVKFDEENKTFG